MPGFSKTVESTIVVRVLAGRPGSRSDAQDALERLERRRRDLEDVAVLARDVMALEHARVGLQRAHAELGAVDCSGAG